MINAKRFFVIVILFIGLTLRFHNYSIYPQRGATSDEYTYSFLGVSLLKKGIPISWSNFSIYKNKYDMTIRNLYFPMVYPYFDHPPFNGLLVGGWSILFGQDTFDDIDLATIRIVPIFLSTLSSLLVFLLGLRLYSYKIGIWAMLIYSTAAIFVINGRVVLAENLLTFLLLSAVYLYIHWKRRLSVRKILTLGVIAGLSFWTKEIGIVVSFTLLYFFIADRMKVTYVVFLSLTCLFFVFLYLLYGAYYDWDGFLKIIAIQADRHIGPQTLHLLTSKPIIVNKPYYDGWYFLGFISLFLSFLNYKKHKILLVPAAAYLLLLIFSITREGEMGWYVIPLFPFMALFISHFLVESFQKKSWFIFILLLFVGLSQVNFIYEENFGLTPFQFRMILFVFFAPLLLLFLFRKERAFVILGHLWFYLLIAGNIYITYYYVHPA